VLAVTAQAGGRRRDGRDGGLPGGAVTFVFTDIEGSTRLVKALRDRYPVVLAEHRRLIRAAIAAHDGHEVDTQGDAFFIAFAGAKQAVLCALAIQRALAAHEWPADGPVRVRIGIHTGHAVPAGGGYTGLAVHRAARISAAARGGQVLISQATASIVEDEEEDPGFTLVDLGERQLKDLDRPVRLFQLAAPGLDSPPGLDLPAVLAFAGLLRQLRDEALLTQEELAEAAGLSPRSVSDLERGISRTARKDTALLLAKALRLDGPVRERFVAAARGKAPAADVLAARRGLEPGAFAAAATRTLPYEIAAFTGRQAELAQLMGTLAAAAAGGGVVGIHAIDGMAGIGKTTFAVHAAHQLAGNFPDGQFFLPLHAHTAGQRPVEPADALASLLLTAGVPAAQIPPGLEARAGRWRDQVAGKKVLLLLDDAAGHEQVRPLLPGTAGSLVLVTSRRRLAALDAAVISLDSLPPGEAAGLLARLAARPGIRSSDPAVAKLSRLCGYLPLAIGMLASQLRHHPAWTASQLAAGLAAAKDRLAVMHAEDVSVAAAFDLSYADLTPGSQRLFRRLGLVPGPDFDAHAAAALDDTSVEEARRLLDELYDQHLIGEPAPGRYRLHDLLREHARALAAAGDPAESDEATGRLLDYYLHTALAAAQRLPTWDFDPGFVPPARPPPCAPPLPTPGQAATWLETERANLHAATAHAAATARLQHATLIPAAMHDFLQAEGHWDQELALDQIALAAARRAGDKPGQARTLLMLSDPQLMTNDRAASAAGTQQALALYRDLGDQVGQVAQIGQATALNGLGSMHLLSGDYRSAAATFQQALELFRGLGNHRGQAYALIHLSVGQRETGNYPAAAATLQQALELSRDTDLYCQGTVLLELGVVQRLAGDYQAAAATLAQAQAVNRDLGDRYQQAVLLSELGALRRVTGDYRAAIASQQQALETLGDLGEPAAQGLARDELGLAQQETGDYAGAAASHQQALRLLRDAGEPYGQAQVLNSLGELASRTSATGQARDHHRQALAIARQIGAPLQEARALAGFGFSHLHDASPGQATAHLQQAFAIYQRIGSPGAQRVRETLRRYGLPLTPTQSTH
jgi:class 3 adenylate cyclase/tetratricopeptide (TPR) repeat protein/transcriptional regulator with XRE-family HTH domain